MNPLDVAGQQFSITLMNPNPTSGRNKSGAWYRVAFEVGEEEFLRFQQANDTAGMILTGILAVVPDVGDEPAPVMEPTKPVKGAYGQVVRSLHQGGFFNALPVAAKLGKPDEYAAWIRRQSCANCGTDQGIEAAHIRRVEHGAGVGIKNQFGEIPLCTACHQLQHNSGESAIGGRKLNDKRWAKYLSEWTKLKFRDGVFEVSSTTYIDASAWVSWANENKLINSIPLKVREIVEREQYNGNETL